MKDFTRDAYRMLLLALQKADYKFFTFEDWCEGKATGRYVILRHDVDLRASHSLATASIESELGIRATYYFRVVPQSNQPEIIKAIVALGHEVGYHYEDLAIAAGNMDNAIAHFKTQLAYFRQFYPVRTVCMHGSPTSQWDNRDLWKTYSYRDFGVIGEPYYDFINLKEILYLTDTARMWDGDKFNIRDKQTNASHDQTKNLSQKSIHTTFDFIEWIQQKPAQQVIMITTHPQRWTNKPTEWIQELLMQNIKNIVKKWIVNKH